MITKILVAIQRWLLSPNVMLRQQKGLCKQCDTKLGARMNMLKPNNALACEGNLYGLFCSDNCELQYLVNQRQKLEAKYKKRIIVHSR